MSVVAIPVFMVILGLLLFGIITGAGVSRARAANPMYRRAPGVVIGLLIGAGFFALLLLFFGVSRRVVVHEPAVAQVVQVATPAPAPSVAYEWNKSMSREPSAPRDPHTSLKTVRAYMADTVESARARVGEGSRKAWVYADKDVPSELVADVRREIKAQELKSATDSTDENDFVVRLRWEDGPSKHSANWSPQPIRRGTLVADVSGPNGNEIVRAKLDEKPWLERSPASYGKREYMVVSSGEATAATRDEAVSRLQQAKASAISQLVEAQVAARSSAGHASSDDVRAQVEANYGDLRLPFDDQVVMRMDRPSGPVWCAAGLVRVPVQDVVQMARSAHSVTYERRTSWAQMIGGAAGMLLLLLVLYAVMNAITRGYFRGHLRAAVAIVLAVAVVMMFLRMA